MRALSLDSDVSGWRWSETSARSAIEIAAVEAAEWDSALSRFIDISIEQTAAFTRARWPNAHYDCLIFKRGDTIIGGALVIVYRLPFNLCTVALSKWAPLLAHCNHVSEDDYQRMVELLKAKYCGDRERSILCVVPRLDPARPLSVPDTLERCGFTRGESARFPKRYVVDLAVSEEKHRKELSSKWRYHLKHSEQAGLTFEEGSAADLPEFDALYGEMVDRKKFPDYAAYHTVASLWDFADKTLQPRLFFVKQNGRKIAGALVFAGGQMAVYMYGATREDALDARAGYFMQWQILRWLRANTKARWYDLGGSDGFQGLHQFKKGLVGKNGVLHHIPPLHYYAEHALLRMLGYLTFSLREKIVNFQKSVEIVLKGLARPDLTPKR